MFLSFFGEGAHVVDVGAHIGTFTVPIAKHVGRSGSVISFEPQPTLFNLLCANVALNGLTNVFTHQAALGKEASVMNISRWRSSYIPFNSGQESIGSNSESKPTSKVTVLTLDSLKLPRIDFIKIDVEGFEEQVLSGAMQTIVSSRPKVAFEYDATRGSSGAVETMKAIGYYCYYSSFPMYNPRNFYGEAINYFTTADGSLSMSFMVLCSPTDVDLSTPGLIARI
jgi:FkbM family methyltransferase